MITDTSLSISLLCWLSIKAAPEKGTNAPSSALPGRILLPYQL